VIAGWSAQSKELILLTGEDRAALRYMQRMNFFNLCSVEMPEKFKRKDPDDSFLPFQAINQGSQAESSLSESIARCVTKTSEKETEEFEWTDQAPEGGVFEAVVYATSELIRNVQQHARGPGFVIAQKYPKGNQTQVVICDMGIGIRSSFEQSGSPYASRINSDADAVELALKPKISSKTHIKDPYYGFRENAGVGLSLLSHIASHQSGNFRLVSGSGFACKEEVRTIRCVSGYKGTLACFQFADDVLANFNALLENAKQDIGLGLPRDNVDIDRIFQ
jgi:hypothetical protein